MKTRAFGVFGIAVLTACMLLGAVPPTTIPSSFFGMHIFHFSSWPLQIPYGEYRFWDTSAQWPSIEICKASNGLPTNMCFYWSILDEILSDLHKNGISTAMYTLSRTPAWGSQNPNDPNCNYYSMSPQFRGACYPPVDLNSDGTGTDQIWKNWVAAIAAHANNSTYLQTHAHIKYWEIWNEFYRSTTLLSYTGSLSWQGTYNQLVRLTEDARCTITGKGTIHNVPTFGSSTSCSATAIDPNAVIVSPSSAANYAGAIHTLQNFLYCNNSPKAKCTVGSAGAEAVDVIALTLSGTSETPEHITSIDLPNLRAVLQSGELAKPLWHGEGSWGTLPEKSNLWNGDAYARAGFIPRFFASIWSAGITQSFWYGYDTNDGQLYNPTKGQQVKPEATAWITTYGWLNGAKPANSPFCQTIGTVHSCEFTRANGIGAMLVWDSKYGPGGTSAPLNCTTSANPTICGKTIYSVPSQFALDWVDVLGVKHAASRTVTIGAVPILLEQ